MKLCIDIQSIAYPGAGVSRYTKGITEKVLQQKKTEDQITLFYFDFLRRANKIYYPQAHLKSISWCPRKVMAKAWKVFHWPSYNFLAGSADLYHFTDFLIHPLKKGYSVVTIYDASFVRHPECFENARLQYIQSQLENTIKQADAIIVDSQFTANELQDLYRADPKKIFTVYGGIADDFCAPNTEIIREVKQKFYLDRPYILSVGTIEPRKNFTFLIDILENLKKFDGDLVIVGRKGWKYESIFSKIENSAYKKRIHWLNGVTDQELKALYAGAELFAFASFYEGFGFPPLEAMNCGTPVISSMGGSLKEVLDGAAVLLNEFKVELWVEQIEKVLFDSELQKTLQKKGKQHVNKYKWDEAAAQTWKIYRQFE